jgi:hypothetical protein
MKIYKSIYAGAVFLMRRSRTTIIDGHMLKEPSKHITFMDNYYQTDDPDEIKFLDGKCKEKGATIVNVDRIESTKSKVKHGLTDSEFNNSLLDKEKQKAVERAQKRHIEFLKKQAQEEEKKEIEDVPL